MTINKLTAGSKGNPFNSKGSDVAQAVNALIDGAEVLPSIKQLHPTAGIVQTVEAFTEGSGLGGGPLIFYPDMSETLHNGGTIIAEGARLAWNGTQADIATILNYVGSDSGCYVRVLLAGTVNAEVSPEMFGATSKGIVDDFLSVSKAASIPDYTMIGSLKYRISDTVQMLCQKINMTGILLADFSDSNKYCIYADNIPNISITTNINGFNSSSKWSGVGFSNCDSATVSNCNISVNQGRAISFSGSRNSSIASNRIVLGEYGDLGIGIQSHGQGNIGSIIELNTIKAKLKISSTTTVGVQPIGEMWGSAGIVLYNGDDIFATGNDRYNWESYNGTYTITGSESVPIFIPVPEITVPSEWECAAANSLNQSTGEWNTFYPLIATPVAGGINISGVTGGTLNRIGVASDVITWQALSYKYGCSNIKIKNNTIDGVIYGGISAFGARDISIVGNVISSCGDIGYDPEGCVRTDISGGIISYCNFGALLVGNRSTVNGITFKKIRTSCVRIKGGNLLYQGVPAGFISPHGLSGANAISSVILNSSLFMVVEALFSDHASDFSISNICGTEGYGSNSRGIEIRGAFNFSVTGGAAGSGPVFTEDCIRFSIRNLVITEARKNSIELNRCSKFFVKNNEGRNSVTALGGANLIRYTGCSNGYISNNDSINLAPGGVNLSDGGGNTLVTAIAGVDL